jgi:hypothetical protein
MKFTIILFVVSAIIFFIFADKSKLYKFLPTCYLAAILDLYTDLVTSHFPFWHYKTAMVYQQIIVHPLNTFGIYFVITYLFLQTLPMKQSIIKISIHIFFWLIPVIIIELIAQRVGVLVYSYGWNIFYSFLSDIFLFLIFYFHYKVSEKQKTGC